MLTPLKSFVSDVVHTNPMEREAHCPQHGAYIQRCYMGNSWTRCPHCESSAAQRAAAREAQAARDNLDASWQVRLGEAGIPPRFQTRTLTNYRADSAGQVYALAFAKSFASEFAEGHSGRCAIFSGEPGTGKTHLAVGIAMHAMNACGRTAHFTSVSKMVRRIREAKSYAAKETESQAIHVFAYPDLLIVDEVGVQSGTDAEAKTLFDVINERYEQCKPTLFLTNLDLAGVRDALGPRLFDRLKEDGGEVVTFDWESQRGSNAA